ncbi:copper resistance D family protein [Brevibacillus sp. 179-C 1.1 NHS]|uniref:copper resistance D family protein n=1 Tax=Brevibacillus sp. 179-C 1.1 NHS TaxID=3235177 RepID=UPI00399EF2ED
MFVISEILLYICFSMVIGGLILELVPDDRKPPIVLPKKVLLLSVSGIGLLSFMPVLRVILFFISDPNIPLPDMISSILFTFEVGKGWLVTLVLSILLFVLLVTRNRTSSSKKLTILSLLVAVGLVIALGWSSHAASYFEWEGFIAHSVHFMAMSVWIGILLVVGWCTKNHSNWSSFLQWFHPVAVFCLTVTIVAGLLLSFKIAPGYFNSWILPYGQALLLKHLLIVPLIIFGVLNGFLMKKRLQKQAGFHPISWIRAESIFVLMIFSVTGFMSIQEPPHDVAQTIKMTEPSQLFMLFYQGVLTDEPAITLSANPLSILLAITTCLFGAMLVWAFMKKFSPLLGVFLGIMFVFSGYLSLMLAIV